MKTTHLKARYSIEELRKWAEVHGAEVLAEIAEETKKKLHDLTVSQMCEPGRPRTFFPRTLIPRSSGRVLIDPRAVDISHHFF